MPNWLDLTTARIEGWPVNTAHTKPIQAPAVEPNFPLTCVCGWKGQLCQVEQEGQFLFCPECHDQLSFSKEVHAVLPVSQEQLREAGLDDLDGLVTRPVQGSPVATTVLVIDPALVAKVTKIALTNHWLECR